MLTASQYRPALDRISRQLLRQVTQTVRGVWRANPIPDAPYATRRQIAATAGRRRTALARLLPGMIRQAREQCWTAALQLLDGEAVSQGVGGDVYHPSLSGYPDRAVATALDDLERRMGTLSGSEADAVAQVGAMAIRHGEQAARDTVRRAADDGPGAETPVRGRCYPVGWARMVTGASSCAFCLMLASRGPVYRSNTVLRTTADAPNIGVKGRRYHDCCDCIAYPVYSLVNQPYAAVADALYDRVYLPARGDDWHDTEAILSRMRRIIREDPRLLDGILDDLHREPVPQGSKTMSQRTVELLRQRTRDTAPSTPGGRSVTKTEVTFSPRLDQLRTGVPHEHLDEITHEQVNPRWDEWLTRKCKTGRSFKTGDNPWAINCQRVVQAVELRMRGYDVRAVGNWDANDDGYDWLIANHWKTLDGQHRRFSRYPTNQETLDHMREYPVGARFFVAGDWKGDGGHIWNAEIIQDQHGNKRIHMIDLQSGDENAIREANGLPRLTEAWKPSSYPRHVKDGKLEFLRVDDMLPTDSLIEGGQTDFTVDNQPYGKPWVTDANAKDPYSETRLKRRIKWEDRSKREHHLKYLNWSTGTPGNNDQSGVSLGELTGSASGIWPSGWDSPDDETMRIILHGNLSLKQGGHMYGTTILGKTQFPKGWDEAAIIAAIVQTITAPTIYGPACDGGRGTYLYGATINGVRIIVKAYKGEHGRLSLRHAYPSWGAGVVKRFQNGSLVPWEVTTTEWKTLMRKYSTTMS